MFFKTIIRMKYEFSVNSENKLFHNEERPAVFGQLENNFIIDLFFERTSDIIKLYII